MEQDYLIGEHRIRTGDERLTKAVAALSGFDVFKVKTFGEPLCWFNTSVMEAPIFEKVLYANEIDGIVSRFGRYNKGYIFEMTPIGGESLKLWVEKNGNTVYFEGNFEERLLRFACWTAYGLVTNPFQTIAIHTSTIQYKDSAVLFLGESGTGKSTHTRLWSENIGETALLNDDSPIIRIIDGKAWVYGSPWSGKTPCYKNEWYPLAACVRLSQAPYNKIKKLSVVQAYASLHPSCPPAFAYDDVLYDYISQTLSLLLSSVPVYHLACLPDSDAARLSFETIFGV